MQYFHAQALSASSPLPCTSAMKGRVKYRSVVWADDFAVLTVLTQLKLTLLLVGHPPARDLSVVCGDAAGTGLPPFFYLFSFSSFEQLLVLLYHKFTLSTYLFDVAISTNPVHSPSFLYVSFLYIYIYIYIYFFFSLFIFA